MVAPGFVLGVVNQPAKPPTDFRLLWYCLALLVATLLLFALILAIVKRWRKRASEGGDWVGDQLTQYRILYERGELSQNEYDRIRSLLGSKIRKELKVPEPSAPQVAQAVVPPATEPQTQPQPQVLPPTEGPGPT